MSVVVREPKTKKIILYTKGTDSVIKERAKVGTNNQVLDQYLENLSVHGLRTLVMGRREFTKEEFENWYERYKEASLSSTDREKLVADVADEIETDLELLGCSGIKDELQGNVKDTIDFFLNTGMLIFILTGDKTETAINVGYQSGVLGENTVQIRIKDCQSKKHFLSKLRIALKYMKRHHFRKKFALIIDAKSLDIALNNFEHQLCVTLKYCVSAIGCRMSPLQKSQITRLVQEKLDKKGLAIGDGVNDVSMIHAATNGVGIMGNEGTQAARTGDFAIPKFRHLKKLVGVHGRYNYIRNSYYLQASFYKNMVIVYMQAFFTFFCAYTGNTVFESWIITFFNTFHTTFVPIYFALFEKGLQKMFY
jgi:phospholipid-transporting ATPase